MTTPPQRPAEESPAPRFDDPTRDIRLPSLPDRPPASVPPEWQTHVRPGEAATSSEPAPPAGTSSLDAAPPVVTTRDGERRPEVTPFAAGAAPAATVVPNSPPERDPLADQPTDKMSAPPRGRQQTLAFDAPPGGAPGPAAAGTLPPGSPADAPAPPAVVSPVPPSSGPPGPPPSGPAGHGVPPYGPPVHGSRPAPARTRRWPWVVLTILPILVIVVSGLLLLWLLRGS